MRMMGRVRRELRMIATGRISVAALLQLLIGWSLCGCFYRHVSEPAVDLKRPVSELNLQDLLKQNNSDPRPSGDYKIGPGDVLTITLVGRPDIIEQPANAPEEGFTVTDNPMLVLPLIGAIRVHGKTSGELEKDLKEAYVKFIIDPQPSVIIKKFQNNQVAVLGQVKTAGKFPLNPGDTLLDALFSAGGVTTMVNPVAGYQPAGRYLKIYREKTNREERREVTLDDLIKKVMEGNRLLTREEITIPIDDYLHTQTLVYNLPLMPNDVIYVPGAGAVMVHGRVNKPGVVYLGPSVRTVSEVLETAGDLKFGAKSEIAVLRTSPTGQTQSYYMNGRRMMHQTARDFTLEDGDKIWVYNHPGRMVLEYLGNFLQRGTSAGLQATYNPMMGAAVP